MLAPTALNWVWFGKLNASARSSTLVRSRTLKDLSIERSQLFQPGSDRILRPVDANVPNAGAAYLVVSNQRSTVRSSCDSIGLPVVTGRWPLEEPTPA